MKTTITHRCGHDSEIQVYGPYATRAGKVSAAEATLCDACRETARAAANAAAADANAAAGLPALTGSGKQVGWAETIRAKAIAAADALIAQCGANAKPGQITPAQVREALVSQTSAGWWIDRKDLPVASLMREVASAIK